MYWIWPVALSLLILIPLLIWAYVWSLRRRKRFAISYSSVALIRAAMPGRSILRRHLPFALFMLALASLILALARPVATTNALSSQSTVILALDVSRSMCSSDVLPNRLVVAQEAAETFIRNQDGGIRIGLVAFAGFAEVIVPPTDDQEALLSAVRNLTTARRTAIGSAILRSVDTIAESNGRIAPVGAFVLPEQSEAAATQTPEVQPDIIVLLTDGASNRGASPLAAAQAAADRGIRVYTIGFGTETGATFQCTRQQLLGAYSDEMFVFGGFGGGFGGGGFRRGVDEPTLREVAAITNAEYYQAESAEELMEVFGAVPAHLSTTKVTTEISVLFAGIGAVFAVSSIALAYLWRPLTV